MKKHVLYVASDFDHYTYEEADTDKTYDLVINGGLDICRVCGEFEAGLDEPCKTNQPFFDENGKPLKCRFCESKNFYESNIYYENHYKVEFQLNCKDCKSILSLWSYGSWEMGEAK